MQPLFLATSLYTYALFLLNNRLITSSCYLIRCYCPHYFFRVRKNMNIIPFVIGTFSLFMNTHIICNLLIQCNLLQNYQIILLLSYNLLSVFQYYSNKRYCNHIFRLHTLEREFQHPSLIFQP